MVESIAALFRWILLLVNQLLHRGKRKVSNKHICEASPQADPLPPSSCMQLSTSSPAWMQVQELELNDNLQSVDNLLTFLEKIFNGGSDFKYGPH